MTLTEFIEQWHADGATLIEFTREKRDGATWILYKVTETERMTEYGRHYALIVAMQGDEIIAHNFHNTSAHEYSFFDQCGDWWKEHLEEGLINPEGRRICA